MAQATMYCSSTPISNETLRHYAPSVFASEPHQSRSGRYTYISTADVLGALSKEGFLPMACGQSRVRDASKREYTKHLVRLRHRDYLGDNKVGTEVPELVLLNSHDGASSYQLMGGIYRLVCSNGMIIGNTSCEARVRHNGDVLADVIEGTYSVVEDIKRTLPVIEEWKARQLTGEQRMAYATSALALRWDTDDAGNVQAPIAASKLLEAKRWDDRGNDLWTTYNKVQEHMIRGGIRGTGSTGRRMTTRAVSSVGENVKLNKALWLLTQQMAALTQ